MEIDLELLSSRLTGRCGEIGLLSTDECRDMIRPVHNHIRMHHPQITVFLLNGDGILCPLKTEALGFFVLLGVCCPVHPFGESVGVASRIGDEDRARLDTETRRIVYDTVHGGEGTAEEGMVVVTRSQMLFDYYFYRYNAESFYPLDQRDRMQFLAARCNRGGGIRDLGIFAVVFTSREYEELARTIRRAIASRGKNAYLLFLKDISYERLITIEGTECIVVVDCPLFDCSHIDLHIPVVSPFEVEFAFSGAWTGRFDKNSFETGGAGTSSCTDLDVVDRAGRLLLRTHSIPFSYEEENMEICMGQRGTAQGYEDEG